MEKSKRHHIILNEVHIHNRVLLSDLARTLNVSMDTVRRDVQELDKLKQLRKVHGGAVSNGFNVYNRDQEVYEYESKTIIAQKGISLLKVGDVVLISGGSTNLEFIKLVPKRMNLTFFTPSLPMAVELLNSPATNKYDVFFIGGKLSRGSQLATGGGSISILADIKADICFLGTGYLDINNGVTEVDWEIAQMKKAMIQASKRLVSLTISKKLNTINRYRICEINKIDTLVTELNPNSDSLAAYRNQGIQML